MTIRRASTLAVVALLAVTFAGCRSTYYKAWETVGREKRDLLRNKVEQVQDDQQDAVESFTTALERLRAMVDVDEPELEKFYDKLSNDLERSEKRAETVRERVDEIEQVSEDLFDEWRSEIEEISSPELRAESSQALRDTRRRYVDLESALHSAEASMEPVLVKLSDQVLALKHRLNAAAVSALTGEVAEIEADVEALIAEMERSIEEAEKFLEGMG